MIYVQIAGVKSEDGCLDGGNGWHDTDDVVQAIAWELERFNSMWDALEHGAPLTYQITVAPEASPRRTKTHRSWPLPYKGKA